MNAQCNSKNAPRGVQTKAWQGRRWFIGLLRDASSFFHECFIILKRLGEKKMRETSKLLSEVKYKHLDETVSRTFQFVMQKMVSNL